MQTARGKQNGRFQYCSFTTIIRRARAVERADRGPRIHHRPLAGARTPALSILLFSHAAIAAIVAVSIHADSNSKNVTLWDIAAHLLC
jgi:hypothetical protein